MWPFLWYWILPWFGLLFIVLALVVTIVATYVLLTAALYVKDEPRIEAPAWTRCTRGKRAS
jgi:hypothetical protein